METQLPSPVFINLDYIFFLIYRALARVLSFFGDNFWQSLKIFATLIVIVLITIILYCMVRLYEINKEGEKVGKSSDPIKEDISEPGQVSVDGANIVRNETWESVRTKILSDSPSDWRLAIIEADIYLDRVLDQKGIFGDTLGDKLKQMTPERFPSVQLAWEAHKVRNRIAHEGSEFMLTQPEARRVLSYFEIVFRDLEVIT